jgi:uncharacterized protein YndB with AHSA1/START domain
MFDSGDSSAAQAGKRQIDETYHFTAPPEVVFGVLTDPHRTYRWLPRGFDVETGDRDRIRIRSGSQVYEFQVQVSTDRLQMRWQPLDGSGRDDSVRVDDAPAGGSVVHAEIAVTGPAEQESRLRDLLGESMRHLQRDVSDNFNAG